MGFWSGFCDEFSGLYRQIASAHLPRLSKLPDVTGAIFPTGPQLDTAKKLIVDTWKSVTGVGPLATAAP